jgi:O-antigen/teichoic acid export membrane protein
MKQEPKDLYSHVLKYTGIFGGVQGLNILVGLVRNKVIALLLGPEGMGLASLFNTAVNFLSQATNLGIPFSAVKHISEFYDKSDQTQIEYCVKVIRVWSLLTALLGMLVCVLLGPILSDYTFGWGDHTLHFVLLAPAVGLIAITGGEIAILKGVRQLRSLAAIQIYNAVLSICISIPIYFFFGETGIVPVIVLSALASMLLTIKHSYHLFPPTLSYPRQMLGSGWSMVRLGVAFVLAGIMGSGAEMLVRSYLNVHGGLNTLGLYNAGFMLTISYAGMVFSSMETDYFPRLSAVCDNRKAMRETVNRQIEVSLLLVSPMLCALIVGMPLIIPLLFTPEFQPVVGMAQVAVFSMYLKSMSLPIAFLSLAKGDSLVYFIIEAADAILLVLLMILGFNLWGLWGTGVALSVSYLIDIVINYLVTWFRYGYRLSLPVLQYASLQLPLGIAAYIVSAFILNPYIYWILNLIFCFLSFIISVTVLKQKTSLWSALKKKLNSRFKSDNHEV